jgi:N-terminal acetyltransferase B complex non-catalytic subunit
LASTELQPADDLALLAASSYVSLWKLTTDDGYLYSAVALLEYALIKSKQSYSAKLMLVRIYRLLGPFFPGHSDVPFDQWCFIGAPAQALEHYRALRVKQVQNETLSYFILSRTSLFSSAAMGDLTFASECLEANQIYLNNSQEV